MPDAMTSPNTEFTRRLRVGVKVLRIVGAREGEEGLEFDGLCVRLAPLADDQVVVVAARAHFSPLR